MSVQLYIENILALEAKARAAGRGTGERVPLAIMTSDDTHARTQQLLEQHGHFGAQPSQIHLIKQEKVLDHPPTHICRGACACMPVVCGGVGV